MESVSRRAVMVGAIGVAGATVAGCSQQKAPEPPPSPTPTVDTTPRWPLTGIPLTAGDDPKRIAVMVKAAATKKDPQNRGLNDADIVFVEADGYVDPPYHEQDIRYVPVFHSKYAAAEAAVRSMRPVDAVILSPITGIIGSSGGVEWVKKYMAGFPDYLVTDLQDANVKSDAYTHAPGLASFRGIVAHPALLAKLTKKFQDGPQQPYFPWAPTDADVSTVNGQPANTIVVPWMKHPYAIKYTWDATKKVYLRSLPWGKHVLKNGDRVTTNNVLIIGAKTTRGHIDLAGKITAGGSHPEPIYYMINGSGTFNYAANGKYVSGTWTKGAVNERFVFTLSDGSPLKMAPGRTFVEMPFVGNKATFQA